MLILDTHVWVWWIGGPACPPLSAHCRHAINESSRIGVSAMSCVEVAWLVAAGRLAFDRDPHTWMEQSLSRPRVELVPITPAIAIAAAELEWDHRDPADRLIVACALKSNARLATKDQSIRDFDGVDTVW